MYESNNCCKGTGILGWFQEISLIFVEVVATGERIGDRVGEEGLECVVKGVKMGSAEPNTITFKTKNLKMSSVVTTGKN